MVIIVVYKRKRNMKKIVLFAMGLIMSMTAMAQNDIETTIKGDIVSSYIWRGQDLGSVAIQPTLGIGYKGLSLTAWGSYGLTNPDDVKEFDLTLGYTLGGFNIGITDYWFSVGLDPDARYFKYDAHGTNHLFEATVGMMVLIRMVSARIVVISRQTSHSNWLRSTGLLRPVSFLSPPHHMVQRALLSPICRCERLRTLK